MDELVPALSGGEIEGEEGAQAAHVGEQGRVLVLQLEEALLEVLARDLDVLEQVLVPDLAQDALHEQHAHGVAHPRVEVAEIGRAHV